LTSNGEHTLAVSSHLYTKDVFRVSGVAARPSVIIIARIVIDIHKAEIVTRDGNSLVIGHADVVNVSTILTSGVNTLYIPTKFDRVRGPLHILGVDETSSIVLFSCDIEVKLFVSTITRSDVGRVKRPIECLNVGAVFVEVLVKGILTVYNFVNVHLVVVRACSEVLLTWGVFHHFTPLFCVLKSLNFSVKIFKVTDRDLTIVSCNSNMTPFG